MFVEVEAQSNFTGTGTPAIIGEVPVNINSPTSTAGNLNVNGGVVFENLGGLTSHNFLNLDANNEVGTVFGYLAPTGGVVGSVLYWNSASWVVNDDIRMSSGDLELGDASFTNDGTLTIFNNVGGSGGNVINITDGTSYFAVRRDGNTGIGGPALLSEKLNIHSSANSYLQFTNGTATSARIGLASASPDFDIRQENNNNLRFFTNATQRMTLSNSGLLGIGTGTPLATLDVRTPALSGINPFRVIYGTDDYMFLDMDGQLGLGSGTLPTLELVKLRLHGLTSSSTYINFYNNACTPPEGGVWMGQPAGSTVFKIEQRESDDIQFRTPDGGGGIATRMIIHDDGRVTVGVTPPFSATKFVIRGSGSPLTGVFDVQSSAVTPASLLFVHENGNIGMGGYLSTERLQLHAPSGDDYMKFSNATTSTGSRIGIPSGSTNFEIRQETGGNMLMFTNGVERMHLAGGGNVGIGDFSTAPNEKLHVHQSAVARDNYIRLTNSATTFTLGGLIGQAANNQNLEIRQEENANMEFYTNGTERMRIYETGGGIGQIEMGGATTDATLIITNAAASITDPILSVNDGVTDFLFVRQDGFVGLGTNASFGLSRNINVNGGGPGPGTIAPNVVFAANGNSEFNGDVTSSTNFYITSDATLKKDFISLADSWKRILEIESFSYNYIEMEGLNLSKRLSFGFKVQDVQKKIPELVNSSEKYLSLNYIGFIPFLTQGIKEHEERIATLEFNDNELINSDLNNEIEDLKSENEILKKENQLIKSRLDALEENLNSICNNPCLRNNFEKNKNVEGSETGQIGHLMEQPVLEQNEPNPFNELTVIRYFLPKGSMNAKIEVKNVEGKIVGSFLITQTGTGNITIVPGTLSAGTYFYSLLINSTIIDTKKMILINR